MVNNVVIVAGGKGLRMGGELPKQFIRIGGKPVLMHTMEAFFRFDPKINLIVVLPSGFRSHWSGLCKELAFCLPHRIVEGGETRFHSVKNGLEYVEEGIVAIHDGARPFISTTLISETFKLARIHKAVIPVTDVTDSLRRIGAGGSSTVIDRTEIKQVQTPQVFAVNTIKDAYRHDYDDSFTDDASVVEKNGTDICLTKGETSNIKITTPFDLKIAEVILNEFI